MGRYFVRSPSFGGRRGRNAGEAALILVLRRTHHFAGQLKNQKAAAFRT